MAAFIDINIVIPEHQVILDKQATVLSTLTDVSRYVVKGASSVDYPTLAPRAGQNIAIGGTFTKNAANYGNDSFNLNEKLGDFFGVNLHQEKQNRLNNLEDSTRETLKSIAKQADQSMISKMIAAATLKDAAPTASLADDIVDMKRQLKEADVPTDDLYICVTPADKAVLEKEVKDFIRYSTDKDGVLGEIYGVKVIESNFSELTQSMMYHRKGAAYAWQGETLFLETVVAGSSSIDYELSRLFGGKATQSGAMIVKRTNV